MRAPTAALPLACAWLVLTAGAVGAADLGEAPYPMPDRAALGAPLTAPRYFPRGDGSDDMRRGGAPARVRVGCVPRRVPVPTNAPSDPSYVGSPYGLSKPSYYGFTPPLGVDDPYGRSLLPYCP